MTGVKSKTAFAEEEKNLDTMISGGINDAFGLVVCDVNGLKYVNDTFGHQAGDAYIRSGSRLICEVFQHSPVYRVGGDEFLVLLTGRDYEARETLLEQFNSRVVENLREDRVVVSAGMSVFIRNEDNCLHDVFERADALMYERKKTLKSMGAKVR
jgi:diguanylate cyclase (GGDEF)-like protein